MSIPTQYSYIMAQNTHTRKVQREHYIPTVLRANKKRENTLQMQYKINKAHIVGTHFDCLFRPIFDVFA